MKKVLFLLLTVITIILSSCGSANDPTVKTELLPMLTTTEVSGITQTTAICGGVISSDAGSSVTVRGVCWANTANPTIANSTTKDNLGIGNYNSKLIGLIPGTTYYVRAYAINNNGTAYGNEIQFTSKVPLNYGTISDIEGNVYKTITIGTQTWMAENLKTTHYRDGSSIGNSWQESSTSGAWCDYSNIAANGIKYGHLYSGYAVSDVRNIAPVGWHVPTDAEWTTLTNYLGGWMLAGNQLKEAGILNWSSPNNGAINSTGFTALPGGVRTFNYGFNSIGNYGYWWSSTQYDTTLAWYRGMGYNYDAVGGGNYSKSNGLSVRCVKD